MATTEDLKGVMSPHQDDAGCSATRPSCSAATTLGWFADRGLVNTSPEIVEDACNFAWMEFIRRQPYREGN